MFKARDPIGIGRVLNLFNPVKQLISDKFKLCRQLLYIIDKRGKRTCDLSGVI